MPDRSCASKIHKRLPKGVFNDVCRFILSVAAHKGLLWGDAIGIDLTTIQANTSMRSIVRKDSGKGWKGCTRKLAQKAGLDNPTDDKLRQFDGNHPGKKLSNDDWENPHDPHATITRMEDGTHRWPTRPSMPSISISIIVVATTVQAGTAPAAATIIDTAVDAATNAEPAGADNEIEAIVARKGHHSTGVVTLTADLRIQVYAP